jgi:hypothetical protein
MDRELVYFSAPLNGLLWAAGGTWWKPFRRIGYPLITTLLVLLFFGFSWRVLAVPCLTFAVTTLPTTLKGDSVTSSWLNRAYVFFWGILLTAPSLLLSMSLVPVVVGLVIGVIVTLSNWEPTAKYFQWKWCEVLIGTLVMYPYCVAV